MFYSPSEPRDGKPVWLWTSPDGSYAMQLSFEPTYQQECDLLGMWKHRLTEPYVVAMNKLTAEYLATLDEEL